MRVSTSEQKKGLLRDVFLKAIIYIEKKKAFVALVNTVALGLTRAGFLNRYQYEAVRIPPLMMGDNGFWKRISSASALLQMIYNKVYSIPDEQLIQLDLALHHLTPRWGFAVNAVLNRSWKSVTRKHCILNKLSTCSTSAMTTRHRVTKIQKVKKL